MERDPWMSTVREWAHLAVCCGLRSLLKDVDIEIHGKNQVAVTL